MEGAIVRACISLGDHKEISRGIWFPQWFEIVYYGKNDESGGTRVVLDAKSIVEEARVNENVTDDVFRFRAPGGAVRLDPYSGAMEQTEPGGFDYMEGMVKSLRKAFPESRARNNGERALWLFAAALTATLVAVGTRRFRLNRSKTREVRP